MRNYLSYGGGVNSTALLLLMHDLGMDFEAVYVDHGCDWPETIEYVNMLREKYPITVIKPNCKKDNIYFDQLFDYCMHRRIIPLRTRRWCTKDFKITPLNKYFDRPAFVHLGIDAGESHRAKIVSDKGLEYRYLLIENNIDRQGCIELINQHNLPEPIKSGCWFCPFQRISQWKLLRRKYPHLWCRAVNLEKIASEHAKRMGITTTNCYLIREGKTLEQIVDDSQSHLWEEMDYPPCQCGL